MSLRRIVLLSFVALPVFMIGAAIQGQSLTNSRWTTGVRPDDRVALNYRAAPYVRAAGVIARHVDGSPQTPSTTVEPLATRSDTAAHSSRALHVVYGLLVGAAAGWGTGIVLDSFMNRNSSRSCNGCDHVYVKMEVLTVPAGAIIGGIVGVLLPTRRGAAPRSEAQTRGVSKWVVALAPVGAQ